MGKIDVAIIVVLVLFVAAQVMFVIQLNAIQPESMQQELLLSPAKFDDGYTLVYLVATVLFAAIIALLFIVKMVRGEKVRSSKGTLPKI